MVTEQTPFTRDIIGRYVCNTFKEAVDSGPFDVVIIGGGTFGLALAQDLHYRTLPGGPKPQNFRILVLEAGPLTFIEHVQDLPNFQIASPGVITGDGPGPTPSIAKPLPSTLDALIQQHLDQQPLFESWGLPWRSTVAFGGLAYTLGGRSLYWGGWSPQYLDSEMPVAPVGVITADNVWPETVVQDLKARFFAEAAEQTGVTTSNLYINGTIHNEYRKRLFNLHPSIAEAVPFTELPNYIPDYIRNGDTALRDQLSSPPYTGFADSVKLDAPLAVQIQTRPGFFPFCKFSSVPLAITAARDAASQSGGVDSNKRLMIVPTCHVTQLFTRPYTLATGATVQEVVGIQTNDGFVDLSLPIAGNVNRRPVVVLAMGAIESARLALNSVGTVPNAGQMGSRLMVHLRKNVPFRATLPGGITVSDPEISALLLRCRTTIAGTPAHFHLQITACAVPPSISPAAQDPFLFQNVPDLDHIRFLANSSPNGVNVVIRAVGEMFPDPTNFVAAISGDNDEHTKARASVVITRRSLEQQLMTAIDSVIAKVASGVFGATVNPGPMPPDGLGTTFHESGTLRMGTDPAKSVVNPDGLFHYVTNLYAGDASVLPTCGSANPVMNGIAIRRRLAKRLAPEGDGDLAAPGTPGGPGVFTPSMPATPPTTGTTMNLFDGATLTNWRMAGRGAFHAIDGALQSVPSFDLGLLWCTVPMPERYRLELEFQIRSNQTNAGVFVRFKNPESSGDYNPAWAAVSSGFEIQIDNTGAPDGRPRHKTGAVYDVNYPNDLPTDPTFPPPTAGDFANLAVASLFPAWNAMRIDVVGDVFTAAVNGSPAAKYTNTDPNRGRFSATDPTFIGLQSYSNYSFPAAFRNIRITVL